MLPFTPIAFVKNNRSTDGSVPKKCLSSQTDLFISSESADFYNSIISRPSSSKNPSKSVQIMKKTNVRQTISEKSFSELYNNVCNDNIEAVRAWFNTYLPDFKNYRKYEPSELTALTDCYGCNIAMTAAVNKSYDSLKFFLMFIPSIVALEDSFGNSFNNIVEKVGDEKIKEIVKIFEKKKSHRPCNKNITKLNKFISQEHYCDICGIQYTDFDHESSIAHLQAENRKVPEVNIHLDSNSIGYKMMTKFGWTESKGLGPSESGRKHLIKTQLKSDRRGFGVSEKSSPKVTHFKPYDEISVKDNLIHKRKITLKTEKKKKKVHDIEKERQWEVDFRRSLNEYE